ncbi:MAG: lipoprotein [Rickettsiales bacterium]|nr:lipoprotein [Rickettsiales bacterium]
MRNIVAASVMVLALCACGLKGDLKRPSEAREEEQPAVQPPAPAPYYYKRQQPYGSL